MTTYTNPGIRPRVRSRGLSAAAAEKSIFEEAVLADEAMTEEDYLDLAAYCMAKAYDLAHPGKNLTLDEMMKELDLA